MTDDTDADASDEATDDETATDAAAEATDETATDGTAEAGDGPDERADPADDPESPFAELGASASDGDPFADLDAEETDAEVPADVAIEDDPFDGDVDAGGDQFAEVDVAELNEEGVWAELGDEASTTAEGEGEEDPDVETAAEEFVVPKTSYCEKCEHFSAPPETACSNPGTEIRELVDVDHFRVANCPVVDRRRSLGYDEN